MQRTLTVLPYAVRPSVDEHRTQRVGDGADVAAQQLGDRKADVRHEGQQQQSDEHAQIERESSLDDKNVILPQLLPTVSETKALPWN